ncbi:RidA family protein [Spirosoma utsteinense]|uniref:Enamine deaminase RidA (YjgF/YER057c/UK114 family) n=1 Tax=Spirosoma utsteinense TaxID=2585773 RepID=A0ABR6W696_9BACT|nr:RidA family protein [Spirosoma utsteinense]MBC3785941.1 enamine deaminase RidA (YjgF/YER057c/UK114 family) [Spirosoma utsteinense]MBC3792111.1 enamine deaminase RidA (YjgF/YER057c/UK114 family) [Spirosoma utsteinense]
MKAYVIFLAGLLVTAVAQAQTTPSPQLGLGYTYKVETGVSGKQVYISGQRPYNANGELVGVGDLSAQTQQVFQNLVAALERVGMTMRNVKQVTYHLKGVPGQVNQSSSQLASTIGTSFFGQVAPGVQEVKSIEKIIRDDMLIEVEVVAVK